MYKAYDDYLNIFLKNNDPSADEWLGERHKQFNQKISDLIHRVQQDEDVTSNLVSALDSFNEPISSALNKIDSKILSIDQTEKLTKDDKLQRCQMAC